MRFPLCSNESAQNRSPSSAPATIPDSALLPVSLLRRAFVLHILAFAALPGVAFAAQVNDREQALSEAEIDKLRDAAPEPQQRVLAFMSFLDKRADSIEKLESGRRHPGREQDIHDLMEQFASISDDLGDNLDDYSHRNLDVRKVLPKLISSVERWATILRTPPEDERYTVSRKLALTSLGDVKDSAQKMVEQQKEYFRLHPPVKDDHRGEHGAL